MLLLTFVLLSVSYLDYAVALPNNSSLQHCIDPRTMKKHPAYTEWADVYSCTRHRCQPRGRNLAIYTVGCKKVEPPESAIECEEVVEDTNMQFPYCCTRLRCLVLVRGEVWTRVLGQPWEKLPAAPWSHMYKMKRPPPGGEPFGNKANDQGPVYELLDPETERHEKVHLRTRTFPDKHCDHPELRAQNGPDIVLALATESDHREPNNDNIGHSKKLGKQRTLRSRLKATLEESDAEDRPKEPEDDELVTEAPMDPSSVENAVNPVTHRSASKSFTKVNVNSNGQNHEENWLSDTDTKWKDRSAETEAPLKQPYPERDIPSSPETDKHTDDKPSNLQALVDAIGTRMKDIENVVQKMSDKVHLGNQENAAPDSNENSHVPLAPESDVEIKKKRPSDDSEHYKRFPVKGRNLKYPRSSREATSELPIYIEDRNINGYFSDPSNTILRRTSNTKEPTHPIYMAPVEPHHKPKGIGETSDEKRRKHKTHKKKHTKGKVHKKHHKDERRRKSGKPGSGEMDRNTVSLEESEDMF